MIPKFRGKSTDKSNKGQWVYGNLIVDGNNALIVNGIVECEEDYVALGDWCPVDLKTVGQSTSMYDKKGDEIFEGDIVNSCRLVNNHIYEYVGQVKFVDFSWNIVDKKDTYDPFYNYTDGYPDEIWEIEVLGNIYQNPVLLESVEE